MEPKITAIIGASTNPERYSYLAAQMLHDAGHPFIPLGVKNGIVFKQNILLDWPKQIEGLHTITLYINPSRQPEYYPYILNLRPKRIIFNPGTENPELAALASIKGIETLDACTLVLLRTNQF